MSDVGSDNGTNRDSITEQFKLDLDTGPQIDERIRTAKSRTANAMAMILVIAFVLSPSLYFITLWLNPEVADKAAGFIEKWYMVMSPLVGAALAAYYGVKITGEKK